VGVDVLVGMALAVGVGFGGVAVGFVVGADVGVAVVAGAGVAEDAEERKRSSILSSMAFGSRYSTPSV
jgi:hypothetical protein